jgi:ABC-type bacteriocin/lantibiotic exporter with double-glycine peptidase domain
MKSLFLSLNTILEAKDLYRIYIMSFLLVLVCALEVVGLVLISFLIVNLGSMDSSLLEMGFISKLNASLKISEDFSQIIFPVMIIIYAIISSIIVFHILKYVTIASQIIGSSIKFNLTRIFLYFNYREVLESQNSENFSRILNDGSELGFLINFILHLFSRLTLAIMIIVLLGFFNPLLTILISLILGFTYIFIFYYFKSTVVVLSHRMSNAKDKTVNIISNLFGAMKEIIVYGNQQKVLSSFDEINLEHARAMGENYFLAQVPRYLIDSLLIILLVLIAVIVNQLSLNSNEFFTTFAVFGIASLKLLPAFQNIFNFSHEINMRLPYLSNAVTIFAKDKAFIEESSIKNKVDEIESVKFESVSFAYANALRPSINKINFVIEHGQNIAIIGPSGSGKSTLIDILLGLLEPDSGSILVNNNPLNDIDKHSYRAHYSYVPQKSYLIEDTLKENILFGSDERDDSEAEIAKILDLVEISPILNQLPNGIDTIISDSTIAFSGGQRQCIGLARALYRKGKILVLDESTNAMDVDLEKKILQNIPQSSFETKIFITHKINILRDVDKIIIMEKGSIIDIGTYDELMQRSEFLKQMLVDTSA